MERVLDGISEAKFQEFSALLKQKIHVDLNGHQGVVENRGFAVSYFYDPSLETLTLKLVKKPWFVPESVVASKVDQYLSGPGADLLKDRPEQS